MEFSHEEIKIKYILCNTSTTTHVIKITKKIEKMEIKMKNENINNHNVNFIIKLQALIK
jgi:hypothetical protein